VRKGSTLADPARGAKPPDDDEDPA